MRPPSRRKYRRAEGEVVFPELPPAGAARPAIVRPQDRRPRKRLRCKQERALRESGNGESRADPPRETISVKCKHQRATPNNCLGGLEPGTQARPRNVAYVFTRLLL